jgi:hypothetical protein
MSKNNTITDLFLAILAIMLIGVSFYQTWLGLQQIFGGSSLIISMVLSLLLLFLLWQLRSAKVNGSATTGLKSIYIFIASFCFIANFNALYTRFMRTDIYSSELRDINEKFNNLETDVQSKLNYSFDPKIASEIEYEKKNLMKQIINEGEPGIGKKARIIIQRIEKLTAPKKVTELRVIGNDYVSLAEQMGDQIDDMISQLSPDEKLLKSDINSAVLKWNRDVPRLLLRSQKEIDEMAQGLIDKSLTDYNKLGNRAHTILGDENFKFTSIYSKTQEVGKIGFAFSHALNNFGMYQFVVLMGCILLDFGIMIIILLVPTAQNNGKGNGGSVFNQQRKGKTIIPN